ncbi:MAG: hypothetical protein GVY16_12190 [Planctomycetes bacterium]|jgi:predicted dehydrogenase|nr:hypothetical protein [Phycisphaerae bacterium]NBB96481.1 hypothetical protein [Planctomycetota bacterium]
MSKPLRVGILGGGVIAPTHAEYCGADQDVEVAWACDLVEDKVRALAEKHNIAAVRDDRDPYVTASSAKHAVENVPGIYESHRNGGRVDVD